MSLLSYVLPIQYPGFVAILVPLALVVLLVGGLALRSVFDWFSVTDDSQVEDLEQRVDELESVVEERSNE
ncbi:hypothetical protein [Haloferax sp. DFSO60]|uniref:hypothetical protein n=1 Tax=Haloferax sp. DFSO60 TaxID=3388652 RepID=UPI00397D6D3D